MNFRNINSHSRQNSLETQIEAVRYNNNMINERHDCIHQYLN